MSEEPKLTTLSNGALEWRLSDGRLHHAEGPACVDGAYQSWWVQGKHHRVGGPAVMYPGGTPEWWLEGVQYSTELGYQMALLLYKGCAV